MPYKLPLVCPEHYARILWRDIGHKGLMPYITAPCARRAPALHRKAVGAVDGHGKMQLEIGKREDVEALKAPVCLLPAS